MTKNTVDPPDAPACAKPQKIVLDPIEDGVAIVRWWETKTVKQDGCLDYDQEVERVRAVPLEELPNLVAAHFGVEIPIAPNDASGLVRDLVDLVEGGTSISRENVLSTAAGYLARKEC